MRLVFQISDTRSYDSATKGEPGAKKKATF